MAASAGPALRRLHARWGHRVEFVTLYVREAHPGERIPQPRTFADKLEQARAYQRRDRIPWTVAVDDVDGTVHQALGRMPDLAYVVDARGLVAGRVLWSNDAPGLDRMLRAVVRGRRPRRPVRYASTRPLLRGLGTTDQVLAAAGRSARRDMLLAAPPVYAAARVGAAFRRLSPLGRGLVGVAAIVVAWFVARRIVRRVVRAAG